VVLSFLDAVVGCGATFLLSAGAIFARALTPVAGVIAAAFGAAIVVLAGFPFLILLVLFVATASLATRYRFAEKRAHAVQEGRAGERGISNVVAHILVPTGLAVAGGLSLLPVATVALLFASALAFGAADTLASEFGVLSGRARSILTLRPVPAGTNGGVSSAGEAFALAGGLVTAGIGLGLFRLFATPFGPILPFVLVVTLAGFLGCQIDSVLGETLENRGWLTKGSTNFLGMLATVGVAWALARGFGGPW
jgi:uncharacterized protein (TIGR00297 family)